MKKIILLLCCVALMFGCKASYKNKRTKEVLDGIFEIRLGMSESEVKALKYSTYHHIYTEELRPGGLSIMKSYAPVEGILIEEVRLNFFKDQLYNITIEKKEDIKKIRELLIKKYGYPDRKRKEKVISTEYKPYAERTDPYDNIKSQEIEVYEEPEETWRTNKKGIECYHSFWIEDLPSIAITITKIQDHVLRRYSSSESSSYTPRKSEEEEAKEKKEKELMDAF